MKACQAKKYDKIFLMISCIDDDQPIQELQEVTEEHQHIEWGWGYQHAMFNEDEIPFVIDTISPHEWTWIPPEIRSMHTMLRNANVYVGGGCESECLQDFVDILEHLDIDYQKINGYIY
jgi:hypothetical protein